MKPQPRKSERPCPVHTDCSTDYLFPERNRPTVLGVGNLLLSDDGVGVHAVTALKRLYTFSPAIDIIDGGTMGLDLLPLFQERDRILILDAADFRKQPGHIDTAEGDAIPAILNPKISVHHIGISDLLAVSKITRENPLEVCLIGIQPKSLDIGLDMTPEISIEFDRLIALTLNKLQAWNIACRRNSENPSQLTLFTV